MFLTDSHKSVIYDFTDVKTDNFYNLCDEILQNFNKWVG